MLLNFWRKKIKINHPTENQAAQSTDDEDEDDLGRLILEDAYWFPILGSFVLLGFYLLLKYVDPALINTVVRWYFAIITVASMWKVNYQSSLFYDVLIPARRVYLS